MPHRMGTLRRQLFSYQGLYFHLQDFAEDNGGERIAGAREDVRFKADQRRPQAVHAGLRPRDLAVPADAMATRFYTWEQQA